jgi:PAS domain S-box-containing protein
MTTGSIVSDERRPSISPMLAKALFDRSLDIILITDRRGRFIDIGPSSLTVLGYRPEEMIGQTGMRFIHPDDLERTRDEMRQARRGQEMQNFESRYVHKNGSIVSLAWNGVWSESEELHFFIGRDVTAAKLVERLKNEFVATVSHELRTPLTSIVGALGLLATQHAATLPVPATRLLAIAQANCQRLLRLVGGILDMDKVESGKVVFTLKEFGIRALVEQAIESNRAPAEGAGVRIILNAVSDAGEMHGDPEWLLKAINNLLSNAIKFSLPGGEVVVGIAKRERNIRVSVRDHGPGIPEEFKSRVFEKFAQADNLDTRTKGGAGLGLSIVKQIVARLGGEVGFADASGGGTIFHFEFPAWKPPVEVASGLEARANVPAHWDKSGGLQ